MNMELKEQLTVSELGVLGISYRKSGEKCGACKSELQ